jgi:capsule polysaccharide export protein KpsE/RkpR
MSIDNKSLDQLTFLDLLRVIKERKKFIFFSSFLISLVIIVFIFVSKALPPSKSYLPDVYTPSAIVLINDQSASSGLTGLLSSSSSLSSLLNISAGSSSGQLALLLAKTNITLDALMNELDYINKKQISNKLRKSAIRNDFYSHYKLTIQSDTNTLTITYKDIDPLFAKNAVNAMVEILNKRFVEIDGGRNKDQAYLLKNKLYDVNNQIQVISNEIKDFQKKYGFYDVDSLVKEQSTVIANLRSDLILKDMELQNYEGYSNKSDPKLQQLRIERNNLESQIAELESGSKKALNMPGKAKMPEIGFKYAEMKRDLEIQEEIYKTLTQQYELSKLGSEGQMATFQILELAETPDSKSSPNRTKMLIIGILASIFISIMMAYAFAFFNRVKLGFHKQ